MPEGTCIKIIRIQIGEYVFYAGTHEQNKKVINVTYQVTFTRLSTVTGHCGIQAHRYNKIIDNSGELNIKFFTPKILGCKIFDLDF